MPLLATPGAFTNARELNFRKQQAEQESRAAQVQGIATTINTEAKTMMTNAKTMIENHIAGGGDPNDLGLLRALEPQFAQLADTINTANQHGIPGVVSLNSIEGGLKAMLAAPARGVTREQEGLDAQSKAKATAIGKAEGTPAEPPKTKAAIDGSTGRREFVSDEAIAAEPSRYRPIKEETQSAAQLAVAVDRKSGESIGAFFYPLGHPVTGHLTTMNEQGDPLPPGWDVIKATAEGGTKDILNTKTSSALEEDIVRSQDSLSVLKDTVSKFNPEFLEFGGRAKIAIAKGISKVNSEALSPKQRQLLKDAGQFYRTAFSTINTTIRDITGAQMSEKEADRIRKQVPDPDTDDPVTFVAKADDVTRELNLIIARKRWMLLNGIQHDFRSDNEPPISIEEFKAKIERRGEELMGAGGNRKDVEAQLREEFGLGQ